MSGEGQIMRIATQNFQLPGRLNGPRTHNQAPEPGPQNPTPPESNPTPPESNQTRPEESWGRKAFRITSGTLMGAAQGALGGYMVQQGGALGTLGAVGLGLGGMVEGGACGWHVGKRVGLAVAGSQGEPIVKGAGALMITFGSPLVGAAAGVAAGIACGASGPLVCAGVFGGMALARELAR